MEIGLIVGKNKKGSWLPGSPVKSIAFPQKLYQKSYNWNKLKTIR
jgi:hypothetical protein